MANDKQIIRKLTLKDANNVNVVYDIGALGENIKYDDNISINEKIDSVATDVQSVSGDITTLNTRVTEISGQITPATQHTTKSVGTAEGIHNLRYYESKLQYYNGSEWVDISTGPEPTPGEYYMWEDATDEQIVNMIQRHYNEELDLTEIWSIGDVRTVSLGNDSTVNAIETSGTYNGFQWQVGESHRMQNIELVIIDFNHDDLTTSISGPTKTFTKAVVTINQKNCLRDSTVSDTDGQNNHENGYMNEDDSTDTFNWYQCRRRAWCNGGYYKAIPQYLRNLIKPVNKLTSTRSRIEISSDYIFLLSEIEIFGVISYSQADEGVQYQHFQQLMTNIYKMPAWSSSAVSNIWWERSPTTYTNTSFCAVGSDGTSSHQDGTYYCGLAPAFCL